jgi:5'-nucleotidase
MNILLTNDDGVTAPGVWAAAAALAEFGQVTLLAPATNYSGYGAALPPSPTLNYYPYERADFSFSHVKAYGLAATPATCAYAGLSGMFGGPFDLLVSGINHGANMGRDVFYSGTFGAALTAHLLGVPAIAVSLDAGPAGVMHWETAAWGAAEAVRLWLANPEPAPALYNVNSPNIARATVSGTLVTSLSERSFLSRYTLHHDAHTEGQLVVRSIAAEDEVETPWTDRWAVRLGYVAISPLQALPDLLGVIPSSFPADSAALSTMPVRQLEPAVQG